MLVDNLQVGEWNESNEYIRKYAYLYIYDNWNRCTGKKLPGVDWVKYVYDKADRVIFTQDGNQRAKSTPEWTFSIPDVHGRTVLTGTCTNTPDANTIGNTVVCAAYPASGAGSYMGYNLSGITLAGYKIMSANYYDNYSFRGLSGFSNPALGYEAAGISAHYLTRYGTDASSYEHKGLLTGTARGILSDSGTLTYMYAAWYYDNRGQRIQTKSTNHLTGGMEKEYIAYNFTGQPLFRTQVHAATGKTTQTEEYSYNYDHAGRLTQVKHKLNGATEIVLAQNTYDETGRLKTSKKGSLPASTYTYNVRSWMKSITGTLFSQTLYYNDSYAGNTRCYNGNISAMSWKTGSETLRGYRFGYDGLSRMTKAEYLLNGSLSDSYKVPSITYDKHGNITALQRWGKTSSGYGLVDNLTMGYNGNQLQYVTDAAVKTPDVAAGLNDFRDASSLTWGEYAYNANGAMTKDLNKGISDIQYNSLNLPSKLVINDVTNRYDYAVDGTKLRVTRGTDVVDYVGNKIYENGSLKRILIEGGYIENGAYHFYMQDHQGNNRVVATGTGTVVQRNHYYPFGMTFGEIAAGEQDKQAYKYNGKELDRKNGLNLYDYSARYMEPALGRFTMMDPMAEKYYSISPYAYCANNPVRFVDPDGRDWWSTNDPGEIERILLQLKNKEKVNTESFGDQWTRVTDKELANGMGVFDDTSLGFTVNGESWENAGYGAKDGMNISYFELGVNSLNKSAEFDGKHLIGPSLIALGQPLDLLKPRGMLGSKAGSSIASYILSKALPFKMGRTGANLARTLTGSSTTNLGRFIGRMIPGLGWGITSMDALYSGVAKPNVEQIQKNILNNKNPLDGTINPTTGEYYIPGSLSFFGF